MNVLCRFLSNHSYLLADMTSVTETFDSIKNNYNLHISLKIEQISVLDSLLRNKSVLAVLPTGYGKSVLYAVMPMLLNKVQ